MLHQVISLEAPAPWGRRKEDIVPFGHRTPHVRGLSWGHISRPWRQDKVRVQKPADCTM